VKAIIEAVSIDGQVSPKHELEIFCPNCGRDVDQAELAAQVCSDCNSSLSDPKQSVSIHVTTLPSAGGKVF